MIKTQGLMDILPVPFFIVSRSGVIKQVSDKALDVFPKTSLFLELVDSGSSKKALDFIFNNEDLPVCVELALHVIGDSVHVFDVVAGLGSNGESIQMICLSKEQEDSSILQQIERLEKRNSELSQLLQIRDVELENALHTIKELSLKYDNLTSVKRLSASVAHEIRNPLTSVRGFLQLMKPYLGEEDKEAYAEIAINEIDRANKIIYEFLNASKTPPPKKEVVPLNSVIEDILILCQSEAVLSNVVLKYRNSSPDIHVKVDSKQIKQVLLNLIQNALQAITDFPLQQYGVISIDSILEDNHVSISVQDNGMGMEPAILKQLFKPFYTTKKDGNGIGLAVCSEIIKDHNGKIKVSSQPGEGATFTITIPIV